LAIFTLPFLAWASFSADADFGNLILSLSLGHVQR
jgi:hypothetical protein